MKMRWIAGMLTVVLALSACAAPGGGGAGASAGSKSAAAEPQKLTAQEAHDRMTGGGERVILDVRTAEEYAEAHIPGAILLPNEDIGDARPAELPVLDTEILIYCRSGNRSAQAAEKLAKLGYTNLYDFGGINDWTYDKESGPWQPAQKEGTLQSFTAYDLSGVPVDESVFAGHKLTMINIWATFCGPCLREMPELGQLARDYADHGVQIIGMVADVPQNEDGTFPQEQVNTARELVKKAGADYLHLLPSADLVRAKLGQVSSVPETIFVDEKGNLVGESYVGARSGEAWGQILDSLLTEAGA